MKPEIKKDIRWRIMRITPAAFLGFVYAPDREIAIEKAREKFDVPATHVERLMAIQDEQ